MHDRIIGALELCCRLNEMLLIQNKRLDWDTHTIGVPGHTTKDTENRRIPFDPDGRLAAILRRRGRLGPEAFVFGTDNGEFVGSFRTAWESLLLIANWLTACHTCVTRPLKSGAPDRIRSWSRRACEPRHDLETVGARPTREASWRARQDSNLWPSAPEADALSS